MQSWAGEESTPSLQVGVKSCVRCSVRLCPAATINFATFSYFSQISLTEMRVDRETISSQKPDLRGLASGAFLSLRLSLFPAGLSFNFRVQSKSDVHGAKNSWHKSHVCCSKLCSSSSARTSVTVTVVGSNCSEGLASSHATSFALCDSSQATDFRCGTLCCAHGLLRASKATPSWPKREHGVPCEHGETV